MVTKASFNSAWCVVRGISLGMFWNGLSSSRDTSFKPRKHSTVKKFRVHPNQIFVTKFVNSMGNTKIITTEKKVAISGKKNTEWGRVSYSVHRIQQQTTVYRTYVQKQMGTVHMQLCELWMALETCEMFGNCVVTHSNKFELP